MPEAKINSKQRKYKTKQTEKEKIFFWELEALEALEALYIHVFKLKNAKHFIMLLFNPFTPGGDQHLISPYNIAPKLTTKVMKIKEMIAT